ncbi:MAG: hypothetical protein KDB53_04100 [Planctomycetes bacterium]|nr:hypothetical protein [Planctomycetota bacterium]
MKLTWALSALVVATAAFFGYRHLQQDGDLRSRLKDSAPSERWIYDDWAAAEAQAKENDKPIFALFRCVP